MKVAMVSRHLPDPAGTAAGRALHALGEGLVAEGHELDVWSWWYEPPAHDLPTWCRWAPLPDEPATRTRVRALVRPRSDVVRGGWTPPAGADVVVADDPVSFAAVARFAPSILTVHYAVGLDARATGERSPRVVQDLRAERSFARRADGVIAYSHRVALAVRASAVMAPIACPLPDVILAPVDAPVAACVADWSWAPNAWGAARLLEIWPIVRTHVAGAQLVLAGPGSDAFDDRSSGVRGLGRVRNSTEVLASAALLAFPCPATSGPKVKVLEAMALGLPVVTTEPGVEGVLGVDGAPARPVVIAPADLAGFAAAVVDLLRDPEGRAAMATAARAVIADGHAPRPAARRRVAAWEEALSSSS